jgi:hypothetical protein
MTRFGTASAKLKAETVAGGTLSCLSSRARKLVTAGDRLRAPQNREQPIAPQELVRKSLLDRNYFIDADGGGGMKNLVKRSSAPNSSL